MRNATPNNNRKNLAIETIASAETEKIAVKYRKTGGIDNQDFEYLIDKYDWTNLVLRNSFVKEIINEKPILSKAFIGFRKALTKKYPEYKYLILRPEWEPVISELFIFGDIQEDTYKNIPFGNVFWTKDTTDTDALYLKIIPGADNQQIFDFLRTPGNDVLRKFKEIGIGVPKVKKRATKTDTGGLELWIRVLDTFSSEEIRSAFALRFSSEYKEKFTINGKRKALERAKDELIANYIFHRFNLKKPDGKPYSGNYIKSIIKKAKDNKTQIKTGLIKQIP